MSSLEQLSDYESFMLFLNTHFDVTLHTEKIPTFHGGGKISFSSEFWINEKPISFLEKLWYYKEDFKLFLKGRKWRHNP